jgi:hypothetical protein
MLKIKVSDPLPRKPFPETPGTVFVYCGRTYMVVGCGPTPFLNDKGRLPDALCLDNGFLYTFYKDGEPWGIEVEATLTRACTEEG